MKQTPGSRPLKKWIIGFENERIPILSFQLPKPVRATGPSEKLVLQLLCLQLLNTELSVESTGIPGGARASLILRILGFVEVVAALGHAVRVTAHPATCEPIALIQRLAALRTRRALVREVVKHFVLA